MGSNMLGTWRIAAWIPQGLSWIWTKTHERTAHPRTDDRALPDLRLPGGAGGFCADGRGADRRAVHARHTDIHDPDDVHGHRLGSAAGDSVLPARRRADDLVQRRHA